VPRLLLYTSLVLLTLLAGVWAVRARLSVPVPASALSDLREDAVTPVVYDWSEVEGFKYRYAGTAIEEGGERYIYYCANIDRADRFFVTDHIVMRRGARDFDSGSWEYGKERVALFPGEVDESGETTWDFEHVCDPEVVAGTFWYQRPGEVEAEKFGYALFYLGIAGMPDYLDGVPDGNVNQIGWAVAKSLEGPWHKVGTAPLITSDAAGHWGVGQPSATSLDHEGEILLFYTRANADGTRTFRQRVSLLDANHPVRHGELELTTHGLRRSDGSPDPLNHGGAFVFDRAHDQFYIIRSGHPFPKVCPDFIADHLQIASIRSEDVWSGGGEWSVVTQLGPGAVPRLFDGGWVRNRFGALADSDTLEALASTSAAGPWDPLCALGIGWLDTYRIHGARIGLTAANSETLDGT
jgi:hypothetical protein